LSCLPSNCISGFSPTTPPIFPVRQMATCPFEPVTTSRSLTACRWRVCLLFPFLQRSGPTQNVFLVVTVGLRNKWEANQVIKKTLKMAPLAIIVKLLLFFSNQIL
jgi:hypothetical protein